MRRCSCSNCSQTLSSWVGGPLLLWCGGSCLLRWVWVKWWWSTLAPCIIMPHTCIIFDFLHICPFLLSEPTPAQILMRKRQQQLGNSSHVSSHAIYVASHLRWPSDFASLYSRSLSASRNVIISWPTFCISGLFLWVAFLPPKPKACFLLPFFSRMPMVCPSF